MWNLQCGDPKETTTTWDRLPFGALLNKTTLVVPLFFDIIRQRRIGQLHLICPLTWRQFRSWPA